MIGIRNKEDTEHESKVKKLLNGLNGSFELKTTKFSVISHVFLFHGWMGNSSVIFHTMFPVPGAFRANVPCSRRF